jgi:peptidoglycan-N-acetylglucosamine deacetylase
MLTFRNTTITFFLLLFLLNILRIAGFGIHFSFALILMIVYLAVSVTFSFFICSGYHMKAFCKGVTTQKIVALTFDDGPDVEFTGRILDLLRDAGVPATFFCIGKKIRGNEQILRRMNDEGHLIGMHSFSHSAWFDFFSQLRMKKEFVLCENEIRQITGKRPLFFRPPYGVINPMVKSALRGTGYHVIGFSRRAWDTTAGSEKKIFSRLSRNIKPGDIILLHDTIGFNLHVVQDLLNHLAGQGFTVVSLHKLLKIDPYEKI